MVLVLLVSFSSRGSAQAYEGARLLGFAEAQRALSTSNDSIYVNPAGLALGSVYSLELGYLDDARGSDRRFNASIIDSQAGPIAGGLAYTYSKRRPDELPSGPDRLEGHRIELSLATKVAENAAIGLTGRYLTFDRRLGDQELEGEGFHELTIDAGIQWRLVAGLSLGLVGYNLTNSERPEVPISWGAGLGYALDELSIEADVRYNAQIGKALYSGGVGYVIAETVPIRTGVSYDLATEALALSFGAGVVLEQLAIDVGYRQSVNAKGDAEDRDQRIIGVAFRGTFL